MASHITGAVAGVAFILIPLLAVLLAAASAQVQIAMDPCSWMTTRNCYAQLTPMKNAELHPDAGGNFNDKEYAKACSSEGCWKPEPNGRFTPPVRKHQVNEEHLTKGKKGKKKDFPADHLPGELPLHNRCYKELSDCPEEVKANFTFFEEGYRRLRDLTCDRNALKGVYKLFSCANESLLSECGRKYFPEASERQSDGCRDAAVYTKCIDETSHHSCPMQHEAFKGSLRRLNTSLQMLLGCERSSQAAVFSESFIVALVAAMLLLLVKSTS